jgi:hypothetical protein
MCSQCKTLKEKAEFHRNASQKGGLQSTCKSCSKARVAAYKSANPVTREKARGYSIKWKYGLSQEGVNTILQTQKNRCPICLDVLNHSRMHVDHCHRSNKIRGLLCFNCNLALGHLKDNEETAARASSYLKRHNEGLEKEIPEEDE